MGLDVYCRVVVGVKLLDHAKSERQLVQETRYNERTGKPYTIDIDAHILTLWNGDEFEEGFGGNMVTGLRNIHDLREWIGEHGLELIQTANNERANTGNLIGMKMGKYLSMRYGPWTLPLPDLGDDVIASVREKLASVGIHVEPGVYFTMEVNN